MPNAAQLETLNGFIGETGDVYEAIRDNPGFDLGTKILYLQRAIMQNTEDFNLSLDLLYNPNLAGVERENNLDFIRSLKNIHNFWSNSEVRYGLYGVRNALTHYFGALGPINADEFRTAVEERITTRITELSTNNAAEVATQRQARIAAEGQIARQTGWRQELDLPEAQQDQVAQNNEENVDFEQVGAIIGADIGADNVINISNNPFHLFMGAGQQQFSEAEIVQIIGITHQEYGEFSQESRQLLSQHPQIVNLLLVNCGATVAQLQQLPAPELQALIDNATKVDIFVNKLHNSFTDLLNMHAQDRLNELNIASKIEFIHFHTEIDYNILLGLPADIFSAISDDPKKLVSLHVRSHINYEALLNLGVNKLTLLMNNQLALDYLSSYAGIPYQELLQLNEAQLTERINQVENIVHVAVDAQIPMQQISSLTQAQQSLLLNCSVTLRNNIEAVSHLIGNNLSLVQLLSLDDEQRNEFLNHPEVITNLISQEGMSFDELSGLPLEGLQGLIAQHEPLQNNPEQPSPF